MPNFERGLYEPGEDVRVFDGSDDDEDVEGSRLPLLIVLALVVLAMFAGVVWLAYTQGVARGRTETPVITAAAGPARIAPQNPGGAQQPYQGFKIYEQPAPPDDDTAASQPPSQAAATPTPPAKVAAAEPALPAKPMPIAPPPVIPAPSPMKAAPAPKPVVATPAPKPVAAAPKVAASAPVTPKPAAVTAPATASGSYVLQIGAYKSQGDADAAWKNYKARHAALLAGYNSDVQQADLGDKGIWYRLRIAGFANKDVASALCDRLKTDGGVCFLGK